MTSASPPGKLSHPQTRPGASQTQRLFLHSLASASVGFGAESFAKVCLRPVTVNLGHVEGPAQGLAHGTCSINTRGTKATEKQTGQRQGTREEGRCGRGWLGRPV